MAAAVTATASTTIRATASADISTTSVIVGVAADLKRRHAQPRHTVGHTVAVNVALPGDELVCRGVVQLAHFFDRHPATARGLNHRRLASDGPSLCRSRQIRNEVRRIGGKRIVGK